MFEDIFQYDHPDKDGWWISELESLCVDTKNNTSNLKDNSNLVEAIKQTLIEEYKQIYHQ